MHGGEWVEDNKEHVAHKRCLRCPRGVYKAQVHLAAARGRRFKCGTRYVMRNADAASFATLELRHGQRLRYVTRNACATLRATHACCPCARGTSVSSWATETAQARAFILDEEKEKKENPFMKIWMVAGYQAVSCHCNFGKIFFYISGFE